MNHTVRLLALIGCSLASIHAADLPVSPKGFGQLEKEPRIIAGGTDELGRKYDYLGQPATHGKLVFTASNGFFTGRVATAKGESDLPKVGDSKLIAPNFAFLDWTGIGHPLRWHVLVRKPGLARFQVYLESATPGSSIEVRFAGQRKTVLVSKSDGSGPQPWELEFDVKEPGEHTLSLEALEVAARGVRKLHRIEGFGVAMDEANLLRARWRPAAAHGNYDTRSVPDVGLLVFSTRSEAPVSSYSPLTTPFGYYGSSFGDDGKSKGSFNFSMWGKPAAAGDLKVMPHLIGVGSPDGQFSGFGHEGSGVKPRGWVPMPDQPEVVVQALRVESGEDYDTYYGYYYDHPSKRWKFFAAGNKWHGGKPSKRLRLGSFCEVPGPPQVQRSGDVYREVRRRGWAWTGEEWKPLEIYRPGGSGSSGKPAVNKLWYTTEEGEYAMGCGGVRMYTHDPARVKPPGPRELPEFLTDGSVKNLFALPIEIEVAPVTEVQADRATIEFTVSSDEALAGGVIYFGLKDALTFAPRKLHGTERKSELSHAIQDHSWTNRVEIEGVKSGVNRVEVGELESDTTYYFRVLVNNAASRVWSHKTFSFTTGK